jgi:hypothetical protein
MTSTSFYVLQMSKQNAPVPSTYYGDLFNFLNKSMSVPNSKFTYLNTYFQKNILVQHHFTFIN